jgi:hypothetical protein
MMVPRRSTFDKARRQDRFRRLARFLRRNRGIDRDLLPLDEVTRRLRLFQQSYVGVRPIPVKDIVGTVGRTRDFDREFLPRRRQVEDRWRRVERAFGDGGFPPIQVYELDGRYFVIDGHHRVAVARQQGIDFIDAEVTRLRTRLPLPPDADISQLIMLDQQRMFMEESGLARTRPEARIEFSRPQGYVELLELVKIHGYHLMQERGEVLPPEEIAADWYDRVYLPALQAIKNQGVYPRAHEGDLFLCVYERQRDLFPERGGVGWEEAARTMKEEEQARKSRSPLPTRRKTR